MRILFLLVVSSLFVALTACSGTPSPTASVDQQFIDMMVPHHEGALAMATLAQQRAQRPEIKRLADAILADQQREIDQMKQWRKAWFGSDQTPPMSAMPMVGGMGGGHGGHGATMDMAADVEKLRTAADPFDLAFIDAMIEHHQSAIDAAQVTQTKAQRPEIKQLASHVITAQQQEIEQMRQWRQAWYGSTLPGQ